MLLSGLKSATQEGAMFKRWKDRRQQLLFERGYNFAAGELLRGTESPLSLEAMQTAKSAFDRGMDAAIRKAVELGITKDNSV